jgi:hypothetical protein
MIAGSVELELGVDQLATTRTEVFARIRYESGPTSGRSLNQAQALCR